MICTADYLIEKRKEKWNEKHSIEYDKKFREAISNELMENKALREEIKEKPEKLIELMFVVVDKNQQTVPFFINDVQHDFIDRLNKAKDDFEKGLITNISLLVLKGRQQGFTTLITAYQLASSILNKNFQGFTLADKVDNSEAIFQNKAKFPHSQLPEVIKPTEKYNNKKQFLFEKLNSSWAVDTATKDVGRSRTVNFFHGSECAFWRDGIASIQAALGEAFTSNCIKIYESTANGYNDYQEMWDSGVHINCFYAWWKTKEYRIKFPNEEIKEEFTENIDDKTDWIWARLKLLRDDIKLDLEQLYWYYKKYEGYLDKEIIKQEYPCFPEEAFLSSGNCVFDKEKIIERLQKVQEPIKRGSFLYDYDGLTIKNIRWQEDKNGIIKIYKDVVPRRPYVIGGDTAGDGSDNFVGEVLDNISGEQVAELSHQTDEDLYARQMYCLGKYYNEALIGVEVNFSTYPEKELERLEYPRLYHRQQIDSITKKYLLKKGFKTDGITRPNIIAGLVGIIRDNIDTINSSALLRECLSFIKNEQGRPEAEQGKHDDRVMAMAIAHYIRTQQAMSIEEQKNKTVEEIREEHDLDDYINYGIGGC